MVGEGAIPVNRDPVHHEVVEVTTLKNAKELGLVFVHLVKALPLKKERVSQNVYEKEWAYKKLTGWPASHCCTSGE